jgi:amino acid adenylation domain-containing protein
MSKRNIEAVYSLSPMQQGMLFHSLYAPESGVYFEQLSATLRGDLDLAAFERAWQRVMDRHPILRTAFAWKSLDRSLQVVHRRVSLQLEQRDWRGASPTEQEARLEGFLQADRARGFDLSRAPLMRLALLRTAEDAYEFVWSHHHILLDGWSLPLLLREVFAFYEAFRQGQDLHLETPPPYRDYIRWLERQDIAEAEAFWRRTLAGFAAPTPLTVDWPLASVADRKERYEEREIQLSRETTAALQSLARQQHLTLSTLVQGAWALLLNRYSGEEDVVFGATVSGRPADLLGAESMVGLFINTLPVRARVPSSMPVAAWLKDLQAQLAQVRDYEYSSLAQIQGWSEVPRGTPLFESILVFENYPVDASLRERKWSLEIGNVRSIEQTNYPLTVVSGPGERLSLKISYDCRRFDADTIRRMLGHLGTLLMGVATQPEGPVASLPLLTNSERQRMLVEWNATQVPYPAGRCVHELFEDQAVRTPDAVALAFEQYHLTYRELDQRANRLAHYLQKREVRPETLVGICVERSLEMIVGMLGVLKAGGAYLPLDPTYPEERLAFMAQDAKVPLLLTQAHLVDRLDLNSKAHGGREEAQHVRPTVICLDSDWRVIAREPESKPESDVTTGNLAYVIYTSGSTGRPKGTLLQHRGLSNLATAFIRDFRLREDGRFLQFASFGFDAAVVEIIAPLLSGASVQLARKDTLLSISDLTGLLQRQGITMATLPPALLRLLPPKELPKLRTVASVGEACSLDIVERWAPGRRLMNGYGPTETTIGASWCEVESLPDGAINVPIGRPIQNLQMYVLDPRLRPVAIGVPGELHIGGTGLARGYLNRAALTAERFIPDPFSGEPGARLYKTGDLVLYSSSGEVEFLGRIDRQVKVRGFRIELGEIEAILSKLPAVQQAAVLARPVEPTGPSTRGTTEKQLVAYLVPSDDLKLDIENVRDALKENLPAYMVPSAHVVLDAMPLLPSGKVNRRALPAPEGTRPELEAAYATPRTPVEEVLAEMWARSLGVERVGVYDDFFDLGGHSLIATQLVSQVRRAFQVEIPLRELFEAPTVAGLAERVEAALRSETNLEAPPIEATTREGDIPLSFAQQRLWFLDQLAPGNLFYNIPTAVRLEGSLDVEALARSLNEIVRRHEVLRTTFRTRDGEPVQVIAQELEPSLSVEDLTHLPEEEREAEARRRVQEEARQPFDLTEGPLLRARLLQLGDREHIAAVTTHHIVSDGWSMSVFVGELAALYEAFASGRASLLPELPIQYADFARWQREWLQGEVLESQLAYWEQQLRDQPLMLDLPTDRPRPAMQTWRGATETFSLPPDLAEQVRALSRDAGVTLFMTLLAAYQTLLRRYSGQEDISVGTAIANRNWQEIEALVGFFVNTLVMRTDLSGAPSFRELLKRVREVALGAYTHQDLPFEMLVDRLQPERDMSHTPLFQVALALQNAPSEPLELPGLTLTPVQADTGTAKFDMMMTISETPDGLSGALEYNTDLFDASTIRRMMGHFRTLLEGAVADPDQPITELPLLTERESRRMLVDWNATALSTPTDRCVHELFEAQAVRQPEALALVFEGGELSYAELDRRANQLAHHLRKLGVGPDELVGISTSRSPEMIVGILGTLKAGGAYLPLDPTYPKERLSFMMEDADIPILLTQALLVDRLTAEDEAQHTQPTVICLDTEWSVIAQEPDDRPESDVTPEHLAYVIYTSGSTGRPKGTMLRHRGLSNLTEAQRRAFGVEEGSRVLQFSPFSFDASVWETFMALANGAALCLGRQEILASGPDLLRLMYEGGVTNVTLPPSVLSVLEPMDLPELKTVISAGEACTAELVAQWAPGRDFFNAYGPTETTVCASMYLCHEDKLGSPPIGRPIANTRLYVLDENMQPLPVGVPGELHVGGVSVAKGYLNRPELTADRFVRDPFGDDPEAHLYKTGDLVRYLEDGNLEFLGRIDHQVKLRGFRIELGEIEAVLRQHADVQEGVALARDDIPGGEGLVAYIVAEDGADLDREELRGFLREKLPHYMVPSFFVAVEQFPLTPAGKVDRRSLPAPDGARPALAREYVGPRTPIEEALAEICADLLGVERVGVGDSFFELGGHSLLATQLISRVQEELGVQMPLRTVFEHPRVAELAERIERLKATEPSDMDKIAELLGEVEQLSEDEARALLEGKGTGDKTGEDLLR